MEVLFYVGYVVNVALFVVLFLPKLFLEGVHNLIWRFYPDGTPNRVRWLADDEEDGAIFREVFAESEAALLRTTLYRVKLRTGDVLSAGTDADVYLCIYGESGNTGKIPLNKAIHTRNKFERAMTDSFDLEREDLGKLEKLTIGHNGKGPSSGWFLEFVEIEASGSVFIFPCEKWLSKHEGDGRIERELYPVEDTDRHLSKIPYQLEITTSELASAGTNADVYVQLYGSEGKTEQVNLDNKSDNFEKGSVDKFKLELRDVGDVQKLRIGHNGKGRQSGWHLGSIILYKPTKKITPRNARWDKSAIKKYYFTCNRWLARSEDDGELVRELPALDEEGNPLSGAGELVSYSVSVHTSDLAGSGTDCNVFLTLYGEKGDSGERRLRKSDNVNKFERNQTDVFSLSCVDLGEVTKVRVRQDDSGSNAAWHCSHVEVGTSGEGGDVTRVFPCQRWLATGEDDGALSRELAPLPIGQTLADLDTAGLALAAQRTSYHVTIYTGDLFGAGTDSDVWLQLFGENQDSGPIQLKSCKSNSINKFERDAKDMFYVECIDLGPVEHLKVWTDGSGAGSDWFLEKVVVDAPELGVKRTFPCEEWLGKDTGDGTLERSLHPAVRADQTYKACTKWEVTVHTSDIRSAGTDAAVFVNLYGEKGRSGKVELGDGRKDKEVLFERGSVDVFIPEIPDIGTRLVKLQLGHDGAGIGSGWHCDKVVARCLEDDHSLIYTFLCGRWLDKGEGDGQLQVDLLPASAVKQSTDGEETEVELNKLSTQTYTVKVHTGDKFGAGTDANVYISVYGSLGDSGERHLNKSENRDKFKRNQVDTFSLDCVDLGDIYKLILREDDTNLGADWFVSSVTVTDSKSNEILFACEQWLSKNKGDKKTKRALHPKGMTMEEVEAAEKGMKEGIEVGKEAGEKPGEVPPPSTIADVKYVLTVHTGTGKEMGTNADAYVILHAGEHASEELSLYHTGEEEEFEPGLRQVFELSAAPLEEKLTGLTVGHNGVLASEGWYIISLDLLVPTSGARYIFQCERWLARDRGDRKLEVKFVPTAVQDLGRLVPYTVTVSTADEEGAGTDSDVTIKVFGETGHSQRITLLSKQGTRFSRGMSVSLPLEIPDLGTITRLRVSLAGGKNNWKPDKFLLSRAGSGGNGNETIQFSNSDFIEKDSEVDIPVWDGKETGAAKSLYKVSVHTSDLFACGTDANVSCILYGETGDSGTLQLSKSENKNKFERGGVDTFEFQLLDLKMVKRIRVWHDDSGVSASWHLTKVVVSDTSVDYNFPCGKWLSSRKDDRNMSRDLICDNLPEEKKKKREGYEVVVYVSNKKDAGTLHDIWISLEGDSMSQKFQISNSTGINLKKGSSDLFYFPSPDVGEVRHVRVGLSPKEWSGKEGSGKERSDKEGSGKDPIKQCHLKQLTVNRSGATEERVFLCNHWLSLPGTPGRKSYRKLGVTSSQPINEDIPARLRATISPDLPQPTLTKYAVQVRTADKFSAGTDANIFLTLFGPKGDSGKQALVGSGKNLFERNQISTFDLELADLGAINKIRIEHDNAGLGASWCLDHVTVTSGRTGEKLMFPCGEWIDKKKGNKKLWRELYPVGREPVPLGLEEEEEEEG